jgi:excisionase family DNA binding protein
MTAAASIPFQPAKRPPAMPSVEPLLTKKATAGLLGVSLRTVERLVVAGELPVVKLGNLVRIDPRDLREYIDKNKGRPA